MFSLYYIWGLIMLNYKAYFKKAFYSKKLYFQLIFSFSIMAILTILSTSIIFSSIYVDNVYSQLEKSNFNNIERLTTEFDNIFFQLRKLNIDLTSSPEITSYLYSDSIDNYNLIKADRMLKTYTSTNPYLYSLILYNKNYVFPTYAGKNGINIDQFITNKNIHPDNSSNLDMVFSKCEQRFYAAHPFEMLSIIFTDFSVIGNRYDNAVIMTLDTQAINKNLLSKNDGTTIVTDNSGKVVFSSDYSLLGSSVGEESYFKTVIGDKDSNGGFKWKSSKDLKIVTFNRSLLSDLYVINFKSYPGINVATNKKLYVFIIICLVITFIYCIISFFLSKLIYSPINKITQMFSSFRDKDTSYEEGEISLITNVFSNTLEHLKTLELTSKNKNIKLKENFLRNALTTCSISDTMKKEMKNYDFNIVFLNLIPIAIKIDDIYKIDSSETYVYETTLYKTIPELLNKDFNCEIVNLFNGELIFFLNFKNQAEYNLDSLLLVLNKIKEVTSQTLHISFTMGIGSTINSIDECKTAYLKAIDMVNHRFVLGLGKIIHEKYLEDNISSIYSYPLEIENKLLTSIRLNDETAYLYNLDLLFELIKNFTYSAVMSILFQVTSTCLKTINESIGRNNNKEILNFDGLDSIFNKLQTLEDTKIYLIDMFHNYQSIKEDANSIKNNKHFNLVNKMQEYIIHNYYNSNLCVEVIAQKTGYAPYYFSKIFKDISGVNINDYIKHIRIENAKELLANTNLKIPDVCEKVGCINISSFYVMFKKVVGLSPAAYREYKQNGTV